MELATISAFILAVAVSPDRSASDLALLFGLLAILLSLSVIDLQHFLLPDSLVIALAVVGLARNLVLGSLDAVSSLLGGAVGLLSLGALAIIPWRSASAFRRPSVQEEVPALPDSHTPTLARSAMGLGDVKLAGAMGLVLGFPGLFTALFGAFIAGGGVGALLIVAGRAKFKSHIPFGPFLCGATAALLLFPELSATFFRLLGFLVE